MALEDIDLNRGLVQKPLPKGGPLISMCKTVPGVFFDSNGIKVDDAMAASAGFDVGELRREKAKGEALETQRKKIEAQFSAETARLDGMSDAELEEEGLVPAGSLLPDPVEAAEPLDRTPFITKTSSGEPRRARVVTDGPVKEMQYDAKAKGWSVRDCDSGKVLGSKLTKDKATELLLAEE
jgi:hypothetical protein